MLYRLDYMDQHASRTVAPVWDNFFDGAWMAPRLDIARERAIEEAAILRLPDRIRRPVLVTKIYGAGLMRPSIIAHPDGRVTRAPR